MSRPLRLGLVGPLPPPNGGMAMQTLQLARLLGDDGVEVHLVPTNAPYKPAFIHRVKILRAAFRLFPYLWHIWRLAERVDVIHVMANSGWSWQLFSAPVLWTGWIRKKPVIVNYRGGEAREYLRDSHFWIRLSLSKAAKIVVPSGFLKAVFSEYGLSTTIIPNILDLDTFKPARDLTTGIELNLVITRNLEPIYGIDTAIRAIASVREKLPDIKLNIAGSGPQYHQLRLLVDELGLDGCVSFLGRLEREEIVALYQSSGAMLNPSRVDNMPNSVMEGLACGLPVISTNVGGIPYLVEDGKSALLIDADDAAGMANAILTLYSHPALQDSLRSAGLQLVQNFAWPRVRDQWLSLYRSQLVCP